VELYDALASALHMRCNGTKLTEARRNKFLQGERVRQAGLRSVKQLLTRKWDEVPAFIESLGREDFKMVLKPVDSAGTDGVYFASTTEEAKAAFDKIMGMVNIFGSANDCVLVQEYLQGVEYVVDSVSYEGTHKVVAFWRYDKRRVNGTPFAYYGLRLFESAGRQIEQRMAEYVHACLDALEISNGPSHAELMWLDGEDAPCLIEVGSRPHGGEGTFVGLTHEPIGYNQISVTLDCIKEPQRFMELPTIPRPLKAHAAEACLVSHREGKLVGFGKGLEEIKGMESVKSIELMVNLGDRMQKTVDIVTAPGSILLGHRDAAVLEREYERIHELEVEELFKVEA
jgi:biotin carboxylase